MTRLTEYSLLSDSVSSIVHVYGTHAQDDTSGGTDGHHSSQEDCYCNWIDRGHDRHRLLRRDHASKDLAADNTSRNADLHWLQQSLWSVGVDREDLARDHARRHLDLHLLHPRLGCRHGDCLRHRGGTCWLPPSHR